MEIIVENVWMTRISDSWEIPTKTAVGLLLATEESCAKVYNQAQVKQSNFSALQYVEHFATGSQVLLQQLHQPQILPCCLLKFQQKDQPICQLESQPTIQPVCKMEIIVENVWMTRISDSWEIPTKTAVGLLLATEESCAKVYNQAQVKQSNFSALQYVDHFATRSKLQILPHNQLEDQLLILLRIL